MITTKYFGVCANTVQRCNWLRLMQARMQTTGLIRTTLKGLVIGFAILLVLFAAIFALAYFNPVLHQADPNAPIVTSCLRSAT